MQHLQLTRAQRVCKRLQEVYKHILHITILCMHGCSNPLFTWHCDNGATSHTHNMAAHATIVCLTTVQIAYTAVHMKPLKCQAHRAHADSKHSPVQASCKPQAASHLKPLSIVSCKRHSFMFCLFMASGQGLRVQGEPQL